MSSLHSVADESRHFVSTARGMADAVRQARPDGGASTFASAIPGAELTSLTQSIREKYVDTCTVLGRGLDNHADSLDTADRDFIATERDNDQLISSITRGLSLGDMSKR